MAALGTFESIGYIFSSVAKSAIAASRILEATGELGLHMLTVFDKILVMADNAIDESTLSDLQSFIDELKKSLASEVKKEEVDQVAIKTIEETIALLQVEHSKASVNYAKQLTKPHVPFKSRFDTED